MTTSEKTLRFQELYNHLKMALAFCDAIKDEPHNQPDMARKIAGQVAKAQSAAIQFQLAVSVSVPQS